MSNSNTGYVATEVYRVDKVGAHFRLFNVNGEDVGTKGISTVTRKNAYNSEKALQMFINKNGEETFRRVDMQVFNSLVVPMNTEKGGDQSENTTTHDEIKDFIHKGSVNLKPETLVMKDLKWKYLVRSAVRGKNIMMTGPSGTGKTLAAKTLVKVLDRPDFYFNLGATQDPRATLIGNTQFAKDKGTFFSESAFIKAIKTPNAIIRLDELSRAHPDAWNILMTVLDYGQRYLRLDEAEGAPIVKVAKGVTFIATANVGTEYTSTRVIDRAILDRFTTIEMDLLSAEEELSLLRMMFPEDVRDSDLKALAETANWTREMCTSEESDITNLISTRATVETAGLLYDGFSLMEAAEISILPFFDADGGLNSSRTQVTQYLQKFMEDEGDSELFNGATNDFDEDDIPDF
jgi:nitric oxide reductase NorQ protein